MSTQFSKLRSRKIVTRLRMLTGVGVLGVITTLAVVRLTLWKIQSERLVLMQQHQVVDHLEQMLSDGWRRTLLCGGLCSCAILWLGYAISQGIYAQVSEIELARADAEQERQTTQKLMHQQQLAAVELEAVYRKLLDISRQAGMAEVATGVLHNVGNVLNSVNVSSTLISETLRKSKINHLARIASLLRDKQSDLGHYITADPAGKQIPGFIQQLSDFLTAEQAETLKEAAQLQKNIEHIKDIVSMQQAYACSTGFLEPVDLRQSVEDAVSINLAAMNRHDITVVREFADVPTVLADRHKVLQIMVNLISNAKHAMKDSPTKILTIRLDSVGGNICVTIRDTGYGIPAENLTRIFSHGFTTKQAGHGFGLHSCALAASEAGGSLQARSQGPGHGAEFVVTLPINSSRLAAAA